MEPLSKKECAPCVEQCDLHARFSVDLLARDRAYTNVGELLFEENTALCTALRACGVPEQLLTGVGADYEKFRALAEHAHLLVGHPALQTCRALLALLLQGEPAVLCAENCDALWQACAVRLAEHPLTPTAILRLCGVKAVAIEQEPTASLDPYRALSARVDFTEITPVFSPVAVLSLSRGVKARMAALSRESGVGITDLATLTEALCRRLGAFEALGCRAAYHTFPPDLRFVRPNEYTADQILRRALQKDGKGITLEEEALFYAQMMRVLGREYLRRDFELQLLVGGEWQPKDMPPFAAGGCPNLAELYRLLCYLDEYSVCPRRVTLLVQYRSDLEALSSLVGCFEGQEGVPALRVGGLARPETIATDFGGYLAAVARVSPVGHFAFADSFAPHPLYYLSAAERHAQLAAYIK